MIMKEKLLTVSALYIRELIYLFISFQESERQNYEKKIQIKYVYVTTQT